MRSSDCAAPSRGHERQTRPATSDRLDGRSAASVTAARPIGSAASRRTRALRGAQQLVVRAAPPATTSVARDGRNVARVERRHVARASAPRSAALVADREVAVRMRAVEQPQERALGHRRRQVLQLAQPIEPQLPDARRSRPRAGSAASSWSASSARRDRRSAPASSARRRGVGADLDVVVAADARQRVGDVDRAERRRCPRPPCRPRRAARPSCPPGSAPEPPLDLQHEA